MLRDPLPSERSALEAGCVDTVGSGAAGGAGETAGAGVDFPGGAAAGFGLGAGNSLSISSTPITADGVSSENQSSSSFFEALTPGTSTLALQPGHCTFLPMSSGGALSRFWH
jgi:hypothetical protein